MATRSELKKEFNEFIHGFMVNKAKDFNTLILFTKVSKRDYRRCQRSLLYYAKNKSVKDLSFTESYLYDQRRFSVLTICRYNKEKTLVSLVPAY